eukprot:6628858-Ditylum_brightwellii.AAC.1
MADRTPAAFQNMYRGSTHGVMLRSSAIDPRLLERRTQMLSREMGKKVEGFRRLEVEEAMM